MQIIRVEGYKAFHGDMRICPKNGIEPFVIVDCDWLYKPDTNCWYGNGRSFLSDICEIIENTEVEINE